MLNSLSFTLAQPSIARPPVICGSTQSLSSSTTIIPIPFLSLENRELLILPRFNNAFMCLRPIPSYVLMTHVQQSPLQAFISHRWFPFQCFHICRKRAQGSVTKNKEKQKQSSFFNLMSPLIPLPFPLSHSYHQLVFTSICPLSVNTNHLHITNFHGCFLCLSFSFLETSFPGLCGLSPLQLSSSLQLFFLGFFLCHFSPTGFLNLMCVEFSLLKPMVSSLHLQPPFLLPPMTIRTIASINNPLSVS